MAAGSELLHSLVVAGVLHQHEGRVSFAADWLYAYLSGGVLSDIGIMPQHHWGEKVVLGLTGNIAVGKSTVLDMLESLGGFVIDADTLVHDLRAPGTPGHHAVVNLMGESILLPDGRLNTRELAARAFADAGLLEDLGRIFRPLVVAEVERLARESAARVVVVEAIRLLEGNLRQQVDQVWVVDAPRALQIERLVEQRDLSPEEAARRVDAQNPQEEKRAAADVLIMNDGDLAHTWAQVRAAWEVVLTALLAAGWLSDELVRAWLRCGLERSQQSTPVDALLVALARLARRMPLNGALPLAQAVALLGAD